jgi:hypothetical protein
MTIRSRLIIRTRLRSVFHRIWPPEPKPLVLMYHRVADEPIDPWDLAVSPANFEEQLLVLRRTRYPLPLTKFVDQLVAGELPRSAVALTLDDGYVDNLVAAKPRLSAADVSATVFLTTGHLDRLEPFCTDSISLAGMTISLGYPTANSQSNSNRPPPKPRCELQSLRAGPVPVRSWDASPRRWTRSKPLLRQSPA